MILKGWSYSHFGDDNQRERDDDYWRRINNDEMLDGVRVRCDDDEQC